MANPYKYVPKINDSVLVKGKPNRHVVVIVRSGNKTADVRTEAGPVILYYDVPWSKLSYLDANQKTPVASTPKQRNFAGDMR
ncbi:MAG: hypothetical protein ABSH02_07590 [Candidatus Sulfotelmatobacter sp.]|jgi:hypothetical protein